MPICFYREREKPYGCFSNFSRHSFWIDEQPWQTVEHYLQAMKFEGTSRVHEIQIAKTPMEAKTMGNGRACPLRPDWEQVNDDVMRRAVYAKFKAHADIREILLATGDEVLIEETTQDTYWGCGTNRLGKNMLGIILMETREILRHES